MERRWSRRVGAACPRRVAPLVRGDDGERKSEGAGEEDAGAREYQLEQPLAAVSGRDAELERMLGPGSPGSRLGVAPPPPGLGACEHGGKGAGVGAAQVVATE